MNVKELRERLGESRDDAQVVIPIHPLSLTLGGTPYIELDVVYDGFDWDSGKFFLAPATHLREVDASYKIEKALYYDREEKLMRISMILRDKNYSEEEMLDKIALVMKDFK